MMEKVTKMVKKVMTKKPNVNPPQKHKRICHFTGATSTQKLQEAEEEKQEKEERKKARAKAAQEKKDKAAAQRWLKATHKAGGGNIKMTPERTTRSPMPKKKPQPKPKPKPQPKPTTAAMRKIKQEPKSDDERDLPSSDDEMVTCTPPKVKKNDGEPTCVQ
jgi:hypothetical protein